MSGPSVVLRVARFDDPVTHTNKKLATLFGTAAALITGVVVGILTMGEGDVVLVAAAEGFGNGTGFIGLFNAGAEWLFDTENSAEISGKLGSNATRTWTENKRNARITDPSICGDPPSVQLRMRFGMDPVSSLLNLPQALSDLFTGNPPGNHADSKIKEGSETVFVENRNASRITEKTTCEGKIAGAASRTWFGGPTVVLAGYEVGHEEGEILAGTIRVIEWLGRAIGGAMKAGTVGAPASILTTALAMDSELHPENRARNERIANQIEGASTIVESMVTGKRPNPVSAGLQIAETLRVQTADAPPPDLRTRVSY